MIASDRVNETRPQIRDPANKNIPRQHRITYPRESGHGDAARRWRRAILHGTRDAAVPSVRAPTRNCGADRSSQPSTVCFFVHRLREYNSYAMSTVSLSSRMPPLAREMRRPHMQCYARQTKHSSYDRSKHQIRSSSPSPHSSPMVTTSHFQPHVLLHRALQHWSSIPPTLRLL